MAGTVRSLRRMVAGVAAGAITVALVSFAQAPPAAAAPAPPPVINLNKVPVKYWPALQSFESDAVQETINGHQLPQSDAWMVSAWGRNSVRAQLWADLASLANRDPSNWTPGEALVMEWFARLQQQRTIAAAEAAIAEYKKYSGLGDADWLTGEPVPFSANGAGYCRYQAPGPFSQDYTGRSSQVCFSRPTLLSLFNFLPPTPSYDEFVSYGEYAAAASVSHSADYQGVSSSTATAIGTGAALAASGVAVPLATKFGTTALNGTKLAAAIFPFSSRVTYVRTGLTAAAKAAVTATNATKAGLAGAHVFGAVTAIVGAVLDIVVTTVLISIQINANKTLPYKLRDLLQAASANTPNLKSLFADAQTNAGLFDLFLEATLPDANLDCTDSGVVVVGPDQAPCANAPAAPAPVAGDPIFEIIPGGVGSTWTRTPSINIESPMGEILSTRLSGHGWLVSQKSDPITMYGCGGLSSWLYDLDYSAYEPVAAEDAVLINATQATGVPQQVGLSVKLRQAADGHLGDITKGAVDFLLFTAGNTSEIPDAQALAVVPAADGVATTSLNGLPAGTYRLVMRTSPTNGFYSAPEVLAHVTVKAPVAPSITSQPVSITRIVGQSAVFSAAASGAPSPTVQWFESSDGFASSKAILGATRSTLVLASVTLGRSRHQFRAVFRNGGGTATTRSASLIVKPAVRPGTPIALRATVARTTAAVRWRAPAGTRPLTYRVRLSRPNSRVFGGWRNLSVPSVLYKRLRAASVYLVQVQARNALGLGSVAGLRFKTLK